MSSPKDFMHTREGVPHHERIKTIMKAHPEIRELIGRNPQSFLYIAGLVTVQISLAFLLRNQPIWLILLVAYFIGAFINHGMFVLIHDASHDLIFKKRIWNTLSLILADLANVVPSSITFRRYHIKHHSFQGVYDMDADLPNRWEARLFGNSALGKAVWMFFFPIFQSLRPPRLKDIKFNSIWTWVNVAVVFSFNAVVWVFFGPKALLFLGASLVFSVGLHPLGARWIQEHYIISYPQETYSYYGPLNKLAFNVGYHNEHHDFPSIPWNRLPDVKKAAPEFYDNLVSHKSWTKLMFRWIFDPELTLFSRMERPNLSKEKIQSQPAAAMASQS
jgi:sphingolipid delta-4 desaturase